MASLKQTLSKNRLPFAEEQGKHEDNLLGLSNVVGVALGNKVKNDVEDQQRPVISVLVSSKMDRELLSSEDTIPKKLGQFETDVVEIGEIFAYNMLAQEELAEQEEELALEYQPQIGYSSPALTRRIRPAMGGFSIGHPNVTAGTLGTGCYDVLPFPGKPTKYYILSNNHVMANSNDAKIGDPILQPGPADGGRLPRDIIARLSRFVPIRFCHEGKCPCNYVDAAIAECNLQDVNRMPYWGGHVKKLYEAPEVGDIVQKTGRTTGFTTGRVTNIHATVFVNYGRGRVAKFCNQVITTDMSAGGDSGSLVTDREERAMGLLFAGSSKSTIINNIAYVQKALGIRITEV